MRYFDLTKSLKRPDVVESIRSYQHLIEKTSDDKILIAVCTTPNNKRNKDV
jgi:DNA polymerase III delta subunit